MRVGDLLRQYDDNRVAADVGPPPGDLAPSIQHNSVCRRTSASEPGLPGVGPLRVSLVGFRFRKLLPRHPAHEPRLAAQFHVQALEELSPFASLRTPSAVQDAPVDARHHVADYVRLHCPLSYRRRALAMSTFT